MNKKTVTNTADNPRYDWIGGRNPRAIEAQEAAGQYGESSITVPLSMLKRKPNNKRYVCPTCSTKDKTVKHARPLCYGI